MNRSDAARIVFEDWFSRICLLACALCLDRCPPRTRLSRLVPALTADCSNWSHFAEIFQGLLLWGGPFTYGVLNLDKKAVDQSLGQESQGLGRETDREKPPPPVLAEAGVKHRVRNPVLSGKAVRLAPRGSSACKIEAGRAHFRVSGNTHHAGRLGTVHPSCAT